ncbi:hypothetical protein ABGB07_05750 [Micromonosporaceae bacterium B7E4]
MLRPVNGLVSTTRTEDWEAALTSGNGRQDALCYGRPDAVRITVSHERLFLALNPPMWGTRWPGSAWRR